MNETQTETLKKEITQIYCKKKIQMKQAAWMHTTFDDNDNFFVRFFAPGQGNCKLQKKIRGEKTTKYKKIY